jgi:hypothetical protein
MLSNDTQKRWNIKLRLKLVTRYCLFFSVCFFSENIHPWLAALVQGFLPDIVGYNQQLGMPMYALTALFSAIHRPRFHQRETLAASSEVFGRFELQGDGTGCAMATPQKRLATSGNQLETAVHMIWKWKSIRIYQDNIRSSRITYNEFKWYHYHWIIWAYPGPLNSAARKPETWSQRPWKLEWRPTCGATGRTPGDGMKSRSGQPCYTQCYG